MNYELAKELKDAGFPQSGSWDDPEHEYWSTYDGGGSESEPELISGHEANFGFMENLYCVPTLEELIEACGEDFVGLQKCGYLTKPSLSNDEWQAWGRQDRYPVGTGPTPEEAVARLWLALNKKDV